MARTVLVTGGAGFVGSNLAVSFRRRYPESEVIALDNLKRRGSELNLTRLREHGVHFVHGDIRNPEDLDLGGFIPEVVVECSAEPSVTAGYGTNPGYLLSTNLLGTINCLEAARRWRSDFIFLSTSRVYPIAGLNSLGFTEGESRFELTDDQVLSGASSRGISSEFPLSGHRSLYGATKLASELLIEEYQVMYGIRGVINRCGVIAGPWQMGRVDQGVFVHWVASHYYERPLSYFGYGGTGKQVRDLLHVDDLFELVDWQARHMHIADRSVYNVGGGAGVSLSLREATEICARVTSNRVEVKGREAEREADVRIYISDNSRVTEAAGWRPNKGPVDIVADIFDWIRANEGPLKGVLAGG